MKYKMAERDGRQLQVGYREFRPADVTGLIACIKDEYSSTYLKPEFYEPDFILNGVAKGEFHFLVAEAEGKIAAALGLKLNMPHETTCEWITGVVLREYRRFGIMNTLFQMALDKMAAMPGISAGYGFSVTYHDISQRAMGHLGFVPCGFMPSVLAIQNISHSFVRDKNTKHHHIIIVKCQEKDNAGTIYVPAEHTNIARQVYDSLGVKVNTESSFVPLSGESHCLVENDAGQASCSIWVEESGADLAARISGIEENYQDPQQTFNIMLNVSDERAVAAYHELRRLGYFFTGFRPISGKNEFMLLHNPGRIQIDFTSLAIAEAGEYLREYVNTCYLNRGNYHG
ncbi:MAG: GNAT family N-acetyltransferase [Selenomonas sp.]|nr:GNAT family N-acetyltransferase [Selenomonas sp.]